MKRYQILVRPKKPAHSKWGFVAHGAIYRDNEGDEIEALLRSHGDKQIRRLPV